LTRTLVLIQLLLLTILLSGQESTSPVTWQGWVQLGQRTYKSMKYQEAAEAFQKAVELNSGELIPHFFLASSLMAQYIPGVNSQKNSDLGRRAETEYLRVLSINPENKTALISVASLNYQQAQTITDPDQRLRKTDEARSWYERTVALYPDQKEAYYWLGVIAWSKYYPIWMNARNHVGMKLSDPGPIPDVTVRKQLKDGYTSTIDNGIFNLEKALQQDSQYDDAMTYMSLFFRARGDLADTPEESLRDAQIAYEWAKKAHGNQNSDARDLPAAVLSPEAPGNAAVKVKLLRKVDPIYPAQAQAAGVLGTVSFRAVIAKDGHVEGLELISGHPLLVESAREAARLWQYEPAVLNGGPVEAVTQADVKFLLPVR
jgi:TonB family protein